MSAMPPPRKIAVLRNTLRLHDNPIYEQGVHLSLLFVDETRVPADDAFAAETVSNTSGTAIGPHQYALLTELLLAHMHDLKCAPPTETRVPHTTVAACGSVDVLVGALRQYTATHPYAGGYHVLIDHVSDAPDVHRDGELVAKLVAAGGFAPEAIAFVNTHAMVDWRQRPEATVRQLTNTKRRVPVVLAEWESICERAECVAPPLDSSSAAARTRVPSSLKNGDVGAWRWIGEAALRSERHRVSTLMTAAGLQQIELQAVWPVAATEVPHCGLEQRVTSALESTRAMVEAKDWQKKDTAANVSLAERAVEPLRRGSHLSPLIALGALSACRVLVAWLGGSCATPPDVPVGSPGDQLLFREVYHATSLLPQFWTNYIDIAQMRCLPGKVEGVAFHYKNAVYWPCDGRWDEAVDAWTSAGGGHNEHKHKDMADSMQLLRKTGWMHHLRRHVVADFLTRGALSLPWELGERWFRHTLLDHDAAVNRGNWLWLSATAYSSRQRRYHYNPANYITKHSHPCVRAVELVGAGGGGEQKKKKTQKRLPRLTDGYADPLRTSDRPYSDTSKPPPAVAHVSAVRGTMPQEHAAGHVAAYTFDDRPDFRPNMSPQEVLRAGSFGGTYFRPIHSAVTHRDHSDMHLELPAAWLAGLDAGRMLTSSTYDKSVNIYGVKCGGSLDMWQSSGWINAIDPLGWFQWYCRFWQGRRTTDDDRQIDRFNRFAGPKGRCRVQLINACDRASKAYDDTTCRPVLRQNLQHWGYRLCKADYHAHTKKKT